MNGSDNGLGKIAFAIVFTIVIIQMLGLAYRGLRFVANYEETTAEVVDCTSEYHSDRTGNYFVYEIVVEGIPYPIQEISSAKPGLRNIFNPKSEFDWCELKGTSITVYYYDRVKTATAFRERPGDMGLLSLVWSVETGAGAIGLFLMPVIAVAALIAGLWFLVSEGKKTFSTIERPRSGGIITLCIVYFNRLLAPLASSVLACILVVFLGLILIKGMLYVESGSNFFTGLFLLIGVTIASLGPGLIFKAAYLLRTSKHEVTVFARNLILVAGLGRLAYNAVDFFSKPDYAGFNEGTTLAFLFEIVNAFFS